MSSHRQESVPTENTLVSVRNLKTYYGRSGPFAGPPVKAVDGVSFDIYQGETVGLVGESGCGKTTLGRTLMQLEERTGGEVVFDGTDITALSGEELREWRQRVSIVFQNPHSSLNERLTVGEIIREPLDIHDWKTPADRRERVRELLSTVGLGTEHYYRYPHQFSGGQRQRVAIARALAPEPEFVVLDEPVSALDVSVQAQILNLLADLQDEFDLTYLFIAHDLSVVRHVSDRVAVMYLGNLAEIGPTEQVFETPQHPYTHALLSAIPDAEQAGYKQEQSITLRGTPPSPSNPPTGCPFTTRCPMKIRPEEYQNVPPEAWDAIEKLREVLKGRETGLQALLYTLKTTVGLAEPRESVPEVAETLIDQHDLPADVETVITDIAETFASGNKEAALTVLDEEFGSICDETPPSKTAHSNAHHSFCHRHRSEYESVEEYHKKLIES